MRAESDAPVPVGFPDGLGEGSREADATLSLRCLLGITPRTLHALLWREGSATGAVGAILAGAAGSDNDRAFLRDVDPAAVRRRLRAAGARFAMPGAPEYWPVFSRLADPPLGVFLRGRPLRLGHRRVAIVGSRRPSSVGVEVARDLGRGVAAAGLVVTSGGAIGIDARAHEAALEVGGTTVAVLGSGIDVDYPATNRRLLGEIVQRGTLVSEYPPGVPAEPFRFPARNRLIAGLSIGVVIVEGVAHSGTRSTADYAVQLGLDVFAVPGPVTSELTAAPHELIRDGARLIGERPICWTIWASRRWRMSPFRSTGCPSRKAPCSPRSASPCFPTPCLGRPDCRSPTPWPRWSGWRSEAWCRATAVDTGGRCFPRGCHRQRRGDGCRPGEGARPTPVRVIASAVGRWDDTSWPWPDPPARPERTRGTPSHRRRVARIPA